MKFLSIEYRGARPSSSKPFFVEVRHNQGESGISVDKCWVSAEYPGHVLDGIVGYSIKPGDTLGGEGIYAVGVFNGVLRDETISKGKVAARLLSIQANREEPDLYGDPDRQGEPKVLGSGDWAPGRVTQIKIPLGAVVEIFREE